MKNTKINKQPEYMGHRDRIRAKFLERGGDALADYEMLELFLFRSVPRKDTKPIAKALMKKFNGRLSEILAAHIDELSVVEGVGDKTAFEIKVTGAIVNRGRQNALKNTIVLDKWAKLIEYCNGQMAHLKKEQFRILFLDVKNQLIIDEVQQEGTIDHTPVYPREVVKRALELSAAGIVLVHNHPSGDPTPSKADIDMTRQIKEATETVDVRLHDHIIIAANGHSSLRGMKLL